MPDSALDRSRPLRLELLARTPHGGTAKTIAERDLARYYRMLSEALATVSLT